VFALTPAAAGHVHKQFEAHTTRKVYWVLRRLDGKTLVELEPLTGRMHQLRVQSAWRGHPVLGDTTYGSTIAFGPPAELPRDRVIALHARRLTISHPSTKEPLTLEAPLPAYWEPVVGTTS
jgi:23S rRNA pseudouridine1911/1915/1917 synthase